MELRKKDFKNCLVLMSDDGYEILVVRQEVLEDFEENRKKYFPKYNRLLNGYDGWMLNRLSREAGFRGIRVYFTVSEGYQMAYETIRDIMPEESMGSEGEYYVSDGDYIYPGGFIKS